MTATHQERLGAYSQNQVTPDNDREIDKRALLTCASRLRDALEDHGKDMVAYRAALQLNQKLWTIFQVAVSDPESPLARDLKVTLLNLSRYVDRVSFRAMTEFMPQLLNSLIDINRAIATGLAKTVAAETPAGQAPAYQTPSYQAPLPSPDAMATHAPVMISA